MKKLLLFLLVLILGGVVFYFNIPKIEESYIYVDNDKASKSLYSKEKQQIKLEDWKILDIKVVNNGSYETLVYFLPTWGDEESFIKEINSLETLGYNLIVINYNLYIKERNHLRSVFDDIILRALDKNNFNKNWLILSWSYFWGYFASDYAYRHGIEKLILFSPIYDSKSYFDKNITSSIHKTFNYNSYETNKILSRYDWDVLFVASEKSRFSDYTSIRKMFKSSPSKKKKFITIAGQADFYIYSYFSWISLYIKDFIGEDNSNKELVIRDEKEVPLHKIYDFETDASIHKFLNNKVSFNSLDYIPENLEDMKSNYYDTSKPMQLKKEANEAFKTLSKDFYRNFWEKIIVVSAYRSYLYQKWIKERWCPDNLCSKAWFSEHQSGLAIDIFETTTNEEFLSKPHLKEYFDWLSDNAHKYWFHNTYQKWLKVDGYEIEPWHWRYLWVDLSTYLKENNITIAEVYNKLEK